MKYLTAIFAAATAGLASAQLGIDDRDVPAICRTICQPLISLSEACSSESSTQSSCICENTSFNIIDLGSQCYICVEAASSLGDDLRSISAACSFTEGAYAQLSASSVAATVVVTATHSGDVLTTSPTTPEATAASTSASLASSSAATGSGNAAPAATMHAAGLLAGAGLAAGLLL